MCEFLPLRRLISRTHNLLYGLIADQSGVSALVTALALTGLVGFTGLATDAVMWQVNYRTMQGAADQAALAGVTAFRNAGETAAVGDSTTAQNAAYAVAIQNGYAAAAITVAAYNGGSCSNDGCIQVTLTQPGQRYFSAIFFGSDFTQSAAAIATCQGCGNGTVNTSSNGGEACVMALDASGKGVITASGTPTLSLQGCNLYNNSPNTNATIVNGSAVIEGCSATSACGSQAFLAQPDSPSGSIDIPVNTAAAAAPDPLAGHITAPAVASSCTSTFPANPVPSGTYCPGTIQTNVIFAAGSVIVITGGLSTKGGSSLTCSGCTLYVVGGASSINANSTINIMAPSSGSYAGVAVWFGDNSTVTWNGANGSSFSGTIYAPNSDVNYSGNAASASTCTRLISGSLSLTGNTTATFDNSTCSASAGAVLASSGTTGSTAYTGAPMLVQ